MQTCLGFFLKSLLESPGNLLEICSLKFVDTLYLFNKVCSSQLLNTTEKFHDLIVIFVVICSVIVPQLLTVAVAVPGS